MRSLLILLLFSMVTTGRTGLIGDVLSSAHNTIHSGIQGAANTFFGGFRFNAGFNAGVNRPSPPRNPSETIVVVVEDHEKPVAPPYNNPPPPGNNFHPGNNYEYLDQSNRPYVPNNENQGNFNQNNNQRPDYDNNYGQNPYNGGNNQNIPQNPNQQFNNNIPQNNKDNSDYENYEKPTSPPYNNNLNQGAYDGSHNFQKNPNYPNNENIITSSSSLKPQTPTTEDMKNDYPYFVPLNPEVNSDTTKSVSPKRDTDTTQNKEDDDDFFPIDVRIKD